MKNTLILLVCMLFLCSRAKEYTLRITHNNGKKDTIKAQWIFDPNEFGIIENGEINLKDGRKFTDVISCETIK